MNISTKILKQLLVVVIVGLSPVGLVYAHNTPTVIDQEHYQFYDNDGTTVNNATSLAGVDTSATVTTGTIFHIRLGALQTANKPDQNLTRDVLLQYSTDASGDCSAGTWTNIPTETGWSSEAFRQITTDNFADGDATSARLDQTHTHIGGDGIETDGDPNAVSFTNGSNSSTEHAEWEWALQEESGTANTYYFRFINADGTTTDVSWTVCATLSTQEPASAPTVSTNAATNVDTTSATLNGEITATGGEDASEHGFAFGTNSSLSGGDTSTSTQGSFTGTGTFASSTSDLDPNTQYFFRAYATNSGGTGFGGINNFTTSSLPPDLSQSAYRWFTNTDTTAVDSASALNTPVVVPSQGTAFRLRMLLHVAGSQLDASATTSKLQFAESDGTCDGNESYSDVQTDSGTIRYFNNSATDDTALTTHHQDPVHRAHTVVAQTYNDGDGAAGNDTFSNSVAAIPAGEDGLWDFALVDNSAPSRTTYCFRAVQEGGGQLTAGYEEFPEITTQDVTRVRLLGRVVLRTVRLF